MKSTKIFSKNPTIIAEENYANNDEEHFNFDLERMKKAIGETDSHGRAKHTLALPQGLTKTQLLAWLDENIPTHLEKRALIS